MRGSINLLSGAGSCGGADSVADHDSVAGTMKQWAGLRPYYRRTLRSGDVRIYFRDVHGYSVWLVVTPETARQVLPGKSYTLEEMPAY
jgi:hypothetical protein